MAEDSKFISAFIFLICYLISIIFILVFYNKRSFLSHKNLYFWIARFVSIFPFVYLCANRAENVGYDTFRYLYNQYFIHDGTYKLEYVEGEKKYKGDCLII